MECHCYMRNVHDKMADGKTTFEKKIWWNIWRTIDSLRNIAWVHNNHEGQVKNTSVWNAAYSWATFHVRKKVGRWLDDSRLCRFARIRTLQQFTWKHVKSQEVFVRENTNFCVQTEFWHFLIVQDNHWLQMETSTQKMMLKSKKATEKEEEQMIRGLWVESLFVDIVKNLVWSFTTQIMKHSRSPWNTST